MKSKPLAALVISLIFASYNQLSAAIVPVLSPPGNETVEGDTSYHHSEMRYRYQQVFDSSFFSELPAGGGLIQAFTFRGDDLPSSGSQTSFFRGAVFFSTTQRDATSLSPVFDSNLGSDNSLFSFRDFGFQIGRSQGSGPQPYTSLFQAEGVAPDRGFFYDPAKGNLLMDIQGLDILPRSSSSFTFDAVTLPGSSSVHYRVADDMVEGTLSSKALVVWFLFKPVPEPSAIALAGLGLVALCWPKRKCFAEVSERPEGSAGDKDEG